MLDKSMPTPSMPIDTCSYVRSAIRAAGGNSDALAPRFAGSSSPHHAASVDQPAIHRSATLGDQLADGDESVETTVLRREERRHAHAQTLVTALPAPHRQAVELRYDIGRSRERTYAEISQILGVPVAQVSQILRQARDLLRSRADT